MGTTENVQLPLQGIVVLELAHTVMGPTAGLVLGDLGADVIRVEPSPSGDKTRRLRGFASGFFSYFNRNKRSLCVDLKSLEGMEIAHKLIKKADVLVENFAPGTMERLGLGWRDLHRLNPKLVLCSLKGFLPGPYENRLALDEIVQFMTGLAYMTGPPGKPLRAGASVVDILGGVMGVVGVLAALRQRDLDGIGRKVNSALYESCAFLVAQHMTGEVMTGKAAPPMPARDSAWAIYETFPTADGVPLFIGITSNKQWESFCTAFGLQEASTDKRFQENEERVLHRAILRPMVARVAAQHSVAALSKKLEEIGIPFSPVRTPGDLFEDPQLCAHGRMMRTRMPNGQVVNLPNLPIEIDGVHFPLRRQPPEAGEDTEGILEELGYSLEEVLKLRRQNKIR